MLMTFVPVYVFLFVQHVLTQNVCSNYRTQECLGQKKTCEIVLKEKSFSCGNSEKNAECIPVPKNGNCLQANNDSATELDCASGLMCLKLDGTDACDDPSTTNPGCKCRKYANDVACTNSNECDSEYCKDGSCTAKVTKGNDCTKTDDCDTGMCLENINDNDNTIDECTGSETGCLCSKNEVLRGNSCFKDEHCATTDACVSGSNSYDQCEQSNNCICTTLLSTNDFCREDHECESNYCEYIDHRTTSPTFAECAGDKCRCMAKVLDEKSCLVEVNGVDRILECASDQFNCLNSVTGEPCAADSTDCKCLKGIPSHHYCTSNGNINNAKKACHNDNESCMTFAFSDIPHTVCTSATSTDCICRESRTHEHCNINFMCAENFQCKSLCDLTADCSSSEDNECICIPDDIDNMQANDPGNGNTNSDSATNGNTLATTIDTTTEKPADSTTTKKTADSSSTDAAFTARKLYKPSFLAIAVYLISL